MKKLLVLFVALAVASTAFAADFSFSWDTDFGWAGNLDDTWNPGAGELELALAADLDEYNSMALEMEAIPDLPTDGDAAYMSFNSFSLTTDLGAYLGLAGIGVEWVNAIHDAPGATKYADFTNVGFETNGLLPGLGGDVTTDVNLDFGTVYASAGANWNLAVDEGDGGTAAGEDMEMLFLVGSTSIVDGLSLEAGLQLNTTTGNEATIFGVDAAYSTAGLTVGGSFSMDSESDVAGEEQALGFGIAYDMDLDDMTAFNASVSVSGDDDEMLRMLGAGVGVGYGDYGADVDMAYAIAANGDYVADGEVADGDLIGIDLSGYVNIGEAQFRVGYAVTDYDWSNNSGAAVPAEGGMYMRITADF